MPVVGTNLLGKKSRFSELFLAILVSEFRFTVFIGAMEWTQGEIGGFTGLNPRHVEYT